MEKFNTGRMYNSTANDFVTKSWAYNKRRAGESGSQASTRIYGQNSITPSNLSSKSWLNATTDSVTKTRAKITSTSKVTLNRAVQNMRHFEAPRTYPNPFAPHLKYGIFSKNRTKPKSPTKRASRVIRQEYTDAIREASLSDSPYFSVRPLVQEDLEIASRHIAIGWNNEKFI